MAKKAERTRNHRITTITDEEAIQVLQWLQRVADGDIPDAANGRIVEVLIRGLSPINEQKHAA